MMTLGVLRPVAPSSTDNAAHHQAEGTPNEIAHPHFIIEGPWLIRSIQNYRSATPPPPAVATGVDLRRRPG